MTSEFKVVKELPALGRDVRPARVDWAAAKQAMIDASPDWVLVAENIAGSIPDQLRKGRNKNFRGDELEHFEFATRKPEGVDYGPRRTNLYGKYTR